MRNALWLMILIVVSGAAQAESVKIDGNDFVSIYGDLPVIRESENGIKMWTLLDYRTPRLFGEKRPYRSMKALTEFDCYGALTSVRYLSFHSGSMGEGKVVAADATAAKWSPIRPSTIEEKFWAFACGQK